MARTRKQTTNQQEEQAEGGDNNRNHEESTDGGASQAPSRKGRSPKKPPGRQVTTRKLPRRQLAAKAKTPERLSRRLRDKVRKDYNLSHLLDTTFKKAAEKKKDQEEEGKKTRAVNDNQQEEEEDESTDTEEEEEEEASPTSNNPTKRTENNKTKGGAGQARAQAVKKRHPGRLTRAMFEGKTREEVMLFHCLYCDWVKPVPEKLWNEPGLNFCSPVNPYIDYVSSLASSHMKADSSYKRVRQHMQEHKADWARTEFWGSARLV